MMSPGPRFEWSVLRTIVNIALEHQQIPMFGIGPHTHIMDSRSQPIKVSRRMMWLRLEVREGDVIYMWDRPFLVRAALEQGGVLLLAAWSLQRVRAFSPTFTAWRLDAALYLEPSADLRLARCWYKTDDGHHAALHQ